MSKRKATKKATKKVKPKNITVFARMDPIQVDQIDLSANLFFNSRSEAIRSMLDLVLRSPKLVNKALTFNDKRKSKMDAQQSDTEISNLFYGAVENYYPDQEILVYSQQFSDFEVLMQDINEKFTPEDAVAAKAFIRHLNSVHLHLDNLFAKIESEDARSEEAVIREYSMKVLFDREDKKEVMDDVAILLRNRDRFNMKRMGLFSSVLA